MGGRLIVSILVIAAVSSCTFPAIQNLVSASSDFVTPTGQTVPRVLQVGFINNTPFRAIFTFGSYDPLNKNTVPTGFGQLRLEANSASAQANLPCRNTVSVGGAELIRLLEANRHAPEINITDDRALVDGVNFSGAPLGDPLEAEPTEGTAPGRLVLDGIDFSCVRTDIKQLTGGGLLIFTFVQDAASPGGFRIDFSFVPKSS